MNMELRDYLKVYWAQRWMIGLMVLVATAAAAIMAASQPVRYSVSQSFAINRVNKQATTDYQFDGYYALQASDLVAQTVVSWFNTPPVLQEAYDQAGLNAEISNPNKLPGRFRVKKYSAQNILVRFTESDQDRAAKLARALQEVVTKHTAELNTSTDNAALFAVVGSRPVISPTKLSPWLAGGLALVVSAVLGMILAAFRFYLKQS